MSTCASPTPLALVVGWSVVVGIPLAAVPQVWKLVRHGAHGVSTLYVALALLSGMVLFTSRALHDVLAVPPCCVDLHSCSSALLPSLQLGLVMVGQMVTQAVFVVATDKAQRRRPLLGVGALALVAVVLAVTGGALLAQHNSTGLVVFTDVLAATASVLQVVLYVPQLLVTWRDRAAGSLSMLGLAIQAAGALVLALDQCCDELQVFIPQMVSILLMTLLLGLCLYFEHWVRRSRVAHTDFVDPGASDVEAAELLTDDLEDEDIGEF